MSWVPDVWRRATRRLRHLPTTVVIGNDRRAVSQLYAAMTAHPRCFGIARHIDYFSLHAARSVAWYRSKFPFAVRVARKRGHVLESSLSYLPTPSALRQMRQVLPKIRVVAVVSDPVERSYSHYLHRRSNAGETRSFAACVAEELRSRSFAPRLGGTLQPKAAPMLGYVSRGYYALQLELLLKLYPRNKVLIVDAESLCAYAPGTCERVFNFMGLEGCDVQSVPGLGYGEDVMRIDANVATILRAHYQPYDELLAELVGQRFSWMPNLVAAAA
jgi:Sulfotransferase domain